MKFNILLVLAASSALTNALPQPLDTQESRDVILIEEREPAPFADASPDSEELWKRKGGGGGGGKGGGSGSSSSGSSSSGSSSSSSGGSSSSSGSRGGLGSSSSSTGGRTTTGSGAKPAYGGGRYYGGGAAVPYSAGGRSASGIAPVLFLGAGIGAFAFFPALWLYGVYSYPYVNPYRFHNTTANENQTKPVQCLCEEYSTCGCDENNDTSYLSDLVGNGSFQALNKSVVTVADVNGTSTILINGSLPNGTTAAGGTDSADGSAAVMLKASGYWLMVAMVGCTVFLT